MRLAFFSLNSGMNAGTDSDKSRRRLVDQGTAISNLIRSTLKFCFLQFLELVSELTSPLAVEFLTKWPTLQTLKKASGRTNRF